MTATRQPLTAVTWGTLLADHAYLSADYARNARLYWSALADLGHELGVRHPHLADGGADVLVDMCAGGVPVILTWTTGRETTTAAVIVEYLSETAVRVRYCGFGHWVQLDQVTSARVFDTVRTWAADA